jgi:hypothetical protein
MEDFILLFKGNEKYKYKSNKYKYFIGTNTITIIDKGA